jgi:hypothetical protein
MYAASLSDAKLAEDGVQHILGVNGTRDFPERSSSGAQLLSCHLDFLPASLVALQRRHALL